MNKKEIAEIKKQFTPANCNITRIATCYVNHEKEIMLNKVEAFLSLPEEEEFKYFDIFKKALSGGKGKTLYDVEFPTVDGGSEKENFLNDLRKSKLDNPELLEEFYQKIIDTYIYGENYLIILIHGMYDVPGKASDESVMEDASEEVYEHILCCICPVSLSKPGLSVNPAESKVENRIRDWVVDMPAHAFLYPAFNDRAMDIHNLLYYSKKTSDMQPEFAFELTGRPEPLISNDEEHQMFAEILQDNSSVTFETMRNFSDAAVSMIEENENADGIKLSTDNLAKMLEEAGMDSDEMQGVLAGYEHKFGDKHKISLTSLVDKTKATVKTGTASIKVDAAYMNELETRMIDGKLCMVLPLNENLVELNGVPVKGIKS